MIHVLVAAIGFVQPDAALDALRTEAEALAPFVVSDTATAFLAETASLAPVEQRVVYYRRDPKTAIAEGDFNALEPDEQEAFRRLEFDTARFYSTFYGSPLAYVRAIDLVAQSGFDELEGTRILDFGYGQIGQLRLLAACGADVTGLDVDPILELLYSEPSDVGEVTGSTGATGSVRLVTGYWPADDQTVASVGGGYDLIIARNIFKRGYVRPVGEVPERMRMDLGVDHDVFREALFDALAPGGRLLIYNLGPAPGDTYNGMADIASPYTRREWYESGFEIWSFETDDSEMARKVGEAFGWGESMDLENGLFGSWTLLRRPDD